MYQKDKRPKSHRKRKIVRRIVFLISIIVIGLIIYGLLHLNSNTVIKQAQPVTQKVTLSKKSTVHFDAPNYGLDLPNDWKFIGKEHSGYTLYHYRAILGGTDSRELDIYEDTIPLNFSLNRALAVEHQDDHLIIKGEVSDNCANYTKTPTATPQIGVRAKWQNIDFLCDEGNTERNVIGTVSTDGLNFIRLTGIKNGTHQYLFTYHDHSVSPDYQILYDALQSFKVK